MKQKYSINKSPFLDLKGNLKVHHQEVKSLEGDLVVVKKKYYQSGDYIKQIVGDKIDLSIYLNLSPVAKNLLFYITTIIEYNNPTFRLKVEDAVTIIKSDKSYIYKAIRELIKADYIARTKTLQVYWINHNRYFKGNYTFEIYAESKTTK